MLLQKQAFSLVNKTSCLDPVKINTRGQFLCVPADCVQAWLLFRLDEGFGQLSEQVVDCHRDLAGLGYRILNIELKGPDTAAPLVRQIERAVRQGRWTENRILVSSFNHVEL
jgi:hypothetical protein